MKTNVFVVALLFLCSGCTSQRSEDLTQQEKDQIKKEIKEVGDSAMAKWERVDCVGAGQRAKTLFCRFGLTVSAETGNRHLQA